MQYLLVAIGGGLGASFRLYLSTLFPLTFWGLPLPIFLINVIGCFLMGFGAELLALYLSASVNWRLFLFTGFLGGFTTFSAFALEFGLLVEKKQYFFALLYVLLSVGCSLLGFFLGLKLVRSW